MSAQYKDYYSTLGVPRSASEAEIKKAFRKQAREFHPDVAKDKKRSEEKFKAANEAYEVLGDSTKRKRYDELGANWKSGANSNGQPGWGNAGGARSGTGTADYEFDGTGFSDFFEQVFGGRRAGGNGRNRGFDVDNAAERGADIEGDMMVTLEEAMRGSLRSVNVSHAVKCDVCGGSGRRGQRVCVACAGEGRVSKSETYQVKVPPGVAAGQRLRLAGRGEAGSRGGATGALFLRVRFAARTARARRRKRRFDCGDSRGSAVTGDGRRAGVVGETGEVVFVQTARMTPFRHPGSHPVTAGASQLLMVLRSMRVSGMWSLCVVAMLLGLNWFAGSARAGGSGLNTLVVINQNSSNSITLGNYYAERRQVPPENILRISWSGGNIVWDGTQFQTNLLQPLLNDIASRGLSNQIHYVVLSMDIPYATSQSNIYNGTTSGLFYGLKTGGGLNAYMLTNSYADSEAAFSAAKPAAAEGYSFLATMLTAGSLAQAKSLVDQGVNSDSTFPTAPVVLAKTSDALRRIRCTAFDNAMFNTRLRGDYSVIRKNANSMWGETNLLGYQTGLMTLTVPPNVFVPGAMADSLTSYGGVIFGPNDQTSLLAFIHGGAAGSYGTVTEPTANAAKFPSPQNYFFQSRGFSLAECYYQSLDIPYQGLIVGEPLAAPFAVTAEEVTALYGEAWAIEDHGTRAADVKGRPGSEQAFVLVRS